MTTKNSPKSSRVKQSLSPNGAIWVAVILGIFCAWDSGVHGWLPRLDRLLLTIQTASMFLLIAVAIVRDIQLKADSLFTAIVAWILFFELGGFLQKDLEYAQRQQCQRLREHGKLAGAKILETRNVFTPRGSDHRPKLSYVRWKVSLPDGRNVMADAIEPKLDYEGKVNHADTVRYLPSDPTCVRAAATIKLASEFSMFDQIRAYFMLILIPSAFNLLIVLWCLSVKKQPKPTATELEEKRRKSDSTLRRLNQFLRRPKTLRRQMLIYGVLGSSMLLFFIVSPLVNIKSRGGPESTEQAAIQHTEAVPTSEQEVFPSPNVPRLVTPYLKKDWEHHIASWEREKNGDSTVYKGYDSHETCLCEFDFEQEAAANPTLQQEYFVNYTPDALRADGFMLLIKVYRYVPHQPGDIFDPDLVYRFEKDYTEYTYKVTGMQDWRNYTYNMPGSTKYLMYATRAHQYGNGTGNDPVVIKLLRDKSNRLIECTLNSKNAIDLRASEQMLKDKFLYWSVFGQYE